MKRPILFRGQRIDTNEWIKDALFYGINPVDKDIVFMGYGGIKMYRIHAGTLQQYTGLNCNDKRVYEGDTIRFRYEDNCEENGYGYISGVVEFENGCFVVKEPGYDYNPSCPPQTLCEWLQDNPCEIVETIK